VSVGVRPGGVARRARLDLDPVALRIGSETFERICGGAPTNCLAFLRLARGLTRKPGGVTDLFLHSESWLRASKSTETGETESDDESFAHFRFLMS
jgi:hypothetical protein